jgi:adenosylcobinamide-GDP ribazoletransferase
MSEKNGENPQAYLAHTSLAWWRDIQIALATLTVLPIRMPEDAGGHERSGSARAFPIAGLVIGVIAAAVFAAAMDLKLWRLVSAIGAILTIVVLTGTRNEMGVAAFADALYRKSKPKDRVTAMDHPHLGVHGLLAILFMVTLKIGLIAAAATTLDSAAALIAASAAARTALPLTTYNLPLAPGAIETPVTVKASRDAMWTAFALGLAFVFLFLGPLTGFVALAFGGLVGAGAAWRVRHELGGYTLEGLAVVVSATEIAVLVAAVIIR